MKKKVLEIFDQIQDSKEPMHLKLQKIYKICTLLLEFPRQVIPVLQQVYIHLAKFSVESGRGDSKIFNNLLYTYEKIVQYINGTLSDDDLQLMGSQQLLNEDFQEKVIFNESMMQFIIDLSMTGVVKNRLVGFKMFYIMVQNLNFRQTYKQYSQYIIKQTMTLVIVLLKDRYANWKSFGIKIAPHLQFQSKKQFKQLSQQINLLILKIISSESNDKIRIEALQKISINSQILPVLTCRIMDKNSEIRMALLEVLKQKKIPLSMFDLCTFYKLLFYCMQTFNQKISYRFIAYIHSFFKAPYSQQNQDDFLTYRYLLQFMQPNILLYYPKILQAFSKFIDNSTDINLERSRQFEDYVRELSLKFSKDKILTNQVFYIRLAASSQNLQLNNIVIYNFLSGPQIGEMILKTFQQNQYFQTNQLLQIIERSLDFDTVAKEKIFDCLLQLLYLRNNYIVPIPKSLLLHPNEVCSLTTESEFNALKFSDNIVSKPPLNTSHSIISRAMQVMFVIQPKRFNQSIKKVLSMLLQELQTSRNTHTTIKSKLKSATRSNRSNEISSLMKHIDQLQLEINFFHQRIIAISLALYTIDKQSSPELFEAILEAIPSDNQEYRVMIHSRFINNCYQNRQDLYIPQFLSFYQRFIEVEEEGNLKSVFIKELTKLAVQLNFVCRFPKYRDKDFSPQIFIDSILDYLFSQDLKLKSIGIESLCSILSCHRIPDTNLLLSCLMLLSYSDHIQMQDILRIRQFFNQFQQKQSLSSAYITVFIALKHMVENSIQLDENIFFHSRKKPKIVLNNFVESSLKTIHFYAILGKKNVAKTFQLYSIFLLTHDPLQNYSEMIQDYFNKLKNKDIDVNFNLCKIINDRLKTSKIKSMKIGQEQFPVTTLQAAQKMLVQTESTSKQYSSSMIDIMKQRRILNFAVKENKQIESNLFTRISDDSSTNSAPISKSYKSDFSSNNSSDSEQPSKYRRKRLLE